MNKPYKQSRLMGEKNNKQEENPTMESSTEGYTIPPSEETIEFESSFFWKDSFEGNTKDSILISNELFTMMKSAEKYTGKQVVGILPIDEKTVQLILAPEEK